MEPLELVRWKAQKLLEQVEQAGYYSADIDDNHVHEVVSVLEDLQDVTSADDVPRQVGGDLFFKAGAIQKELGIEGFSTEFRKIHEVLGRDAELEEQLVEGEKQLPDAVRRQLDEQMRRETDGQ